MAIQTAGLPTTLLEMLAAQPSTAPLLLEARHQDPQRFTSYGQALRFCQPGGEGDLRRLGVQPGEVVATWLPLGAVPPLPWLFSPLPVRPARHLWIRA